MAAKKKKKSSGKRKCKFGVNKRTKKCLKTPRKKSASKSRARGTMDWLTGGYEPIRTRRSGGMTIREYSPADSARMIFG
jgi:hypothetical protein